MLNHGTFEGVDGTELWYGVSGEGPTLVLCDGFACDGFIWPYLMDHFHEEFRIVRWHYRGHGQSENPKDMTRIGIEDLCGDLERLLDHLEIDDATLIGHSMGVQVILTFAHLYAERVNAVVPICGTYKHPLDTFHNSDRAAQLLPMLDRAIAFAPDKIQAFWSTMTPSRISVLASRFEINSRLARESDFVPYLDHVADMDVRVFIAMLKRLQAHSAEPFLNDISVPAFIIAGEFDSFTPAYRSEELADFLPDSELIVVPNGTHIAPLELPDLVNASIEKFLRRI